MMLMFHFSQDGDVEKQDGSAWLYFFPVSVFPETAVGVGIPSPPPPPVLFI